MFDTVKNLWDGFLGKFKDNDEGRRLIWLLLIVFIAGWVVTAFAAWLSFPAYLSLVQYFPGAVQVAIGFTGVVAIFIYFALGYMAGYAVQSWRRNMKSYTSLGARIMGFSVVLFLAVDFYMNMAGKDVRATEAAGAFAVFSYTTPAADLQTIQAAQTKLSEIEVGNVGGYGWRDPKTGIFWLNKSGKSAAADLRATIRRTQQADSTSRAAFLADQATANERRAGIEASAKTTLTKAVYGVYVLVAILCIVQAFINETLSPKTSTIAPKSTNGVGAKVQGQPSQVRTMGGGFWGRLFGRPSLVTAQANTGASTAAINATVGRAITATGGGYQIICQHCGNEALMKSHRAKYCCEACKENAYTARTGRKVNKGGKKRKQIGFKP